MYSPAYSSPRAEGAELTLQKAAPLELLDDASVDEEIAEQIRKGILDADGLAPVGSEDLETVPRQVFRRKVTKKVEVPIMRKVKVPVTTTKIVEDVELQTVKTRKLVQEEELKWVDETYTEIEEQPATRVREIWVKKLVKEPYLKKVEVQKTRKVQVPTMTTKEVEVETQVEVPTTKTVEVPSYRIDEIRDTKLVEVEGWQEVELVPRVKDSAVRIEKSRDIETHRRHLERRVGVLQYYEEDRRLGNVDTDSDPDDEASPTVARYQADVQLDGTERRTRPPRGGHRTGTAHFASAPPQDSPVQRREMQLPPARDSPHHVIPMPAASRPRASKPMTFGFRLVEQGTSKGLLVTQIMPGGYADLYKVAVGDVVTAADGRALATIRQWRALLARKASNDVVTLTVKRGPDETQQLRIQLSNFDSAPYQ